jgi:hypothetical protein
MNSKLYAALLESLRAHTPGERHEADLLALFAEHPFCTTRTLGPASPRPAEPGRALRVSRVA